MEDPLKQLGEMLMYGEFSGKINGKRTKIKLIGKGLNEFANYRLTADENMLCGKGMSCWKSNISGKLKKVEYVDE